jgi:hypothetical protein
MKTNAIALRIDSSRLDTMTVMISAANGIILTMKPTCSHTKLNIIAVFRNEVDRDWCIGLAFVEDFSEVEIECSVKRLAA